MFGDVNNVTLLGNVTRDPDLRYTPNGSAVISFSLATNRRYKKGEEWTDEVSYHNIVVWNNAESLSQRIKKGTRLYIEGRIQTRSWEDKEGKKQYKTEVVADRVLLIARFEGDNSSAQSEGTSAAPEDTSSDDEAIDPNDLPF
ncbi:Single-stranded DNA-binding protein [Patescibacteria group bacterium]|nr:Single-stranded DNA-binding protein [Patescibacteria group bacterium]